MTVSLAKEKIEAAILSAKAKLTEAGFYTVARSFFTDKNLIESREFSAKAILIFGDLQVGFEDMDSDDFCDFTICCEIKTGAVDELEIVKGIKTFEDEVAAFIEKAAAAKDPRAFIEEISAEQDADAEKAAIEFSKEMRKVKLKLYLSLGAIIAVIAAVLIGGAFLG